MVSDEIRLEFFKNLKEYRGFPYYFVKSVLNMHLIYKGQKDILESFENNKITVVTSGHSTGKTAIEAGICLYWLCTRYKARVIVIAPTWRQLQTVFYAEVNKWYSKSILKNMDLFLLKQSIMQFNHDVLKKEWFMLPISPKSSDQLQGQHGDKSIQVEEIMKNLGIEFIDPEDLELQETIIKLLQNPGEKKEDEDLLVIVDEASGVKDEMIEVLLGADPSKVLVCGNMTKTTGFFYEMAFGNKKTGVNVIKLSSENSPWMKKSNIQTIAETYGKDSNIYRVRILGLPPDGDEDTCISRELVEKSKNVPKAIDFKDIEILGVDPARYGGDYTAGWSSTGSEFKEEFYYDKRHLFRMGREAEHFSAGDERLIIPYRGWNICLLVCYDLRFPVWSRNVANQYDLLIYVANWPIPRRLVWDTLLRARALENQCYVCGVNRVGIDGYQQKYN
ncbi:nitrilase-related carbon-nitrogen hydrolase, partial [uncultured Fusobacterium sp.]|uniref:nitrilase-related carbon-nitrogen hydrolase n=1 Tax=uncultured Fusobacterium sp. TaxID=159267 RepID=UPI0025E5E001